MVNYVICERYLNKSIKKKRISVLCSLFSRLFAEIPLFLKPEALSVYFQAVNISSLHHNFKPKV